MATQLNIKDPVLIERARVLARSRGQSVTATLRGIVDQAWDARETEVSERLARLTAFTRTLQASVPVELRQFTSKEIMDSIYDDDQPDGFAE